MSNKYPGGIITSGANAGYSVAFDGSGDYLRVASNAAFDLSGDFTIECWVYTTNLSPGYNSNMISRWAAAGGTIYNIQIQNGGTFRFVSAANAYTGGSITVNTWTHVAVTRSGTSIRMFRDGVLQSTNTDSTNFSGSQVLSIGAEGDGASALPGYISNARIVKGTALYTAAFTPPTQLLNVTNTSLLTCNSPAIVDQSSNNFTITANGNAAVSTFTPFTGTQLVPNPNTLANTQGVWSISDAAYWMSQNKWPMPPSYPLQSLRFNSADSAYLTRTPTSTSNRQTFTWSGWVKIGKNPYSTGGYLFSSRQSGTDNFGININSSMQLVVDGAIGGTAINLITTPVYRDSSAWYHVVLAVDTTQATSTNRVKLYVNGTQVTAFGTATYPTQSNTSVNLNTAIHNVSGYNNSSNYFDGYMADVNFVDGQALTPSSFGANDPNTGVWSPVPYSGTYGTNGFRLSFQDNTGTTATTLGKDYSGNGNNWTPNNFSVAAGSGNDSLTDGPTNWGIDYGNGGEVRGNYATLNPLDAGSNLTFSDGNLQISSSANPNNNCRGTLGVASGKWYWEVTPTAGAGGTVIGIASDTASVTTNFSGDMYCYDSNGNKVVNGSSSAYGATYGTNDVIGVAFDADNRTITFYKNNTSQGTISSITSGLTWRPFVHANSKTVVANFGQRPFAYPAPSGFKTLCTTNLPTPAIGASASTLASKNFDVSTYTGNGGTLAVTNGGFQPDLVWGKSRSAATANLLVDAVRGTGVYLISNTTAAEGSAANTVTAFNAGGFTLGSDNTLNTNAATYAAWQWKAGNGTVSNTAGTITSTVSANQTAGISVVTYTGNNTSGATVGHGLGATPGFIITKRRNVSGNWVCWHKTFSGTQYIPLNLTSSVQTLSSVYNATPTSSVFQVGNDIDINASGGTYVSYCFAEIAGFSKFGSYTGNGSADGPFVYCGFRPRYVMIKRTDSTGDWWIWDTSRNAYNITGKYLYANTSGAEGDDSATPGDLDILSNGFKLRIATYQPNASGATFIFMAFAESPFNYSRAR